MRERLSGLFENSNGHFATHGRKLIQKDLEGVPLLKIVEEILYRHSRTGEHWRTALDLRANHHDRLVHLITLRAAKVLV